MPTVALVRSTRAQPLPWASRDGATVLAMFSTCSGFMAASSVLGTSVPFLGAKAESHSGASSTGLSCARDTAHNVGAHQRQLIAAHRVRNGKRRDGASTSSSSSAASNLITVQYLMPRVVPPSHLTYPPSPVTAPLGPCPWAFSRLRARCTAACPAAQAFGRVPLALTLWIVFQGGAP